MFYNMSFGRQMEGKTDKQITKSISEIIHTVIYILNKKETLHSLFLNFKLQNIFRYCYIFVSFFRHQTTACTIFSSSIICQKCIQLRLKTPQTIKNNNNNNNKQTNKQTTKKKKKHVMRMAQSLKLLHCRNWLTTISQKQFEPEVIYNNINILCILNCRPCN